MYFFSLFLFLFPFDPDLSFGGFDISLWSCLLHYFKGKIIISSVSIIHVSEYRNKTWNSLGRRLVRRQFGVQELQLRRTFSILSSLPIVCKEGCSQQSRPGFPGHPPARWARCHCASWALSPAATSSASSEGHQRNLPRVAGATHSHLMFPFQRSCRELGLSEVAQWFKDHIYQPV